MSSNIKIPKVCNYCKQSYIAKTTITKFCSLDCARKAYKENKRNLKIQDAQIEEYNKSAGIDYNVINAKDFLSIKESCLLLGVSRMSLYRYIKNDLIHPSAIGGRVIISRKSINKLLKRSRWEYMSEKKQ
jgi:hypothetical protein